MESVEISKSVVVNQTKNKRLRSNTYSYFTVQAYISLLFTNIMIIARIKNV